MATNSQHPMRDCVHHQSSLLTVPASLISVPGCAMGKLHRKSKLAQGARQTGASWTSQLECEWHGRCGPLSGRARIQAALHVPPSRIQTQTPIALRIALGVATFLYHVRPLAPQHTASPLRGPGQVLAARGTNFRWCLAAFHKVWVPRSQLCVLGAVKRMQTGPSVGIEDLKWGDHPPQVWANLT